MNATYSGVEEKRTPRLRRPSVEDECRRHGHRWDNEPGSFVCVRCGFELEPTEDRSTLVLITFEYPEWE